MRFNLFPADVTVGERLYEGARVFDDGAGQVHVFVTGDDGQPQVVASARLAVELNGGGPIPNTIMTETGVWGLRLSRYCHCRDPLKRTGPERLMAVLAGADA